MVMVTVDHRIGDPAVQLCDRCQRYLPFLGNVSVCYVTHTCHVLDILACYVIRDPLVQICHVSGVVLGIVLGNILDIAHNGKGIGGVEAVAADGLHFLLGQPIFAEAQVHVARLVLHIAAAGGQLPVRKRVGIVIICAVSVVGSDLLRRAHVIKQGNGSDLAAEYAGVGLVEAVVVTDHEGQLGHVARDVAKPDAGAVALHVCAVLIAMAAIVFRIDYHRNMRPYAGLNLCFGEIELSDAVRVILQLIPLEIRIQTVGVGILQRQMPIAIVPKAIVIT